MTPGNYKWEPGRGPSQDAAARMRAHFSMPREPMGEAWFMSPERRFFHELTESPVEQLPPDTLTTVLFEISSGTSSFGHREEWNSWFKYMLPGLVRRATEFRFFSELLAQNVVSAFMSVYWKGVAEEYPGFRGDVLDSLSLCLMDEELWFEHADEATGETYPKASFLAWRDDDESVRLDWHTGKANENLSALLFFCMKYLPAEEIGGWVGSVFAVRDPYWKGALAVWLAGAYDLLREPVVLPSMLEKSRPRLSWDDSHCLGSSHGSVGAEYPPDEEFNDDKDFLPPENVAATLRAVRARLTPEKILDWAECFSRDGLLAEATYGVPETLLEKVTDADRVSAERVEHEN